MSGRIIDVHGHIGRIAANGKRSEQVEATTLIRNMDILGISKTCVLPLSDSPEGWYSKASTEDIIEACSEYPERLIPFCLIDPRFGDNSPETNFRDLLNEYKERGCVGLGEFIAKFPLNDPKCVNLFRQAGEIGFPVLFDMDVRSGYGVIDEPGLPHLEKALQLCPDTTFIGHGPTFWASVSLDDDFYGYPKGPVKKGGTISRLMQQYDNLWADLSAGSGFNALTRDAAFGVEFLNQFSHKLLFGTDVCVPYGQAPILGFLDKIRVEQKLSEEKYNKIMEFNAVALLNI